MGDSWIELLDVAEAKFLVFFTEHSPRMTYSQVIRLMNSSIQPEFIECHSGNNGLDFQLVTYLGYELHDDEFDEIIIVSNDTGFDAVVSFWKERGITISRISNVNLCTNEEPVSDVELVTDFSSENVSKELCGVNLYELYTIINCIGKDNPSFIHAVFDHFYPYPNSSNIYKIFKKIDFQVPPVQWKNSTKFKKLVTLILHYENTVNKEVPESFISFLMNNINKDRKIMRKRLMTQYPKDGEYFYLVFKPFFSTLAVIK